jgi:DNA-binding beta-propeller fold protein YncE
MNRKNLVFIFVLIFTILVAVIVEYQAHAALEWQITKTLEIDGTPLDVALSPDGKNIFVLTDQGRILVYSTKNTPTDQIEVGNQIDQIRVGPQGKVLLLNSKKNRTVQIFSLDFIQSIDTEGSPFKGPEDAPVVIAVFDDFQ